MGQTQGAHGTLQSSGTSPSYPRSPSSSSYSVVQSIPSSINTNSPPQGIEGSSSHQNLLRGVPATSSTSPTTGQSVNIDQRLQQTNPSLMPARTGVHRVASSTSSTSSFTSQIPSSVGSSQFHLPPSMMQRPGSCTPYGSFQHSQPSSVQAPNGSLPSRPLSLFCHVPHYPPPHPQPEPHPRTVLPAAPQWKPGNGLNATSGFSHHQGTIPVATALPGDLNVSPTSSGSSVDSLQTPSNHRSQSSSPSAFPPAIGEGGTRTAQFYSSNSPVFQQNPQAPPHQIHPHSQIHPSNQPHIQMTPGPLPSHSHPQQPPPQQQQQIIDSQNMHQPPQQQQPQQVGRRVRTLYDCVGENPAELTFEPNSIIYNVRPSREPGKSLYLNCL